MADYDKEAEIGVGPDQLQEALNYLTDRCSHLEALFESTIQAWAAATAQRELHSTCHHQRVTDLACAIAAEMGLRDDKVKVLRVAATLHDIGQMCIPADVFSESRRLTDIQHMAIRIHPSVGYDCLKGIPFDGPVAKIILQHHERLDGSGYPRGLAGDEIMLEAKILAVADVVEAMSSKRAYRPAFGVARALKEIQENAGALYDKAVVEACTQIFESGQFTFEPLEQD